MGASGTLWVLPLFVEFPPAFPNPTVFGFRTVRRGTCLGVSWEPDPGRQYERGGA